MLAPKRVLHRKVQRGSMKGHAKGNTKLYFGDYGLRAEEAHWITIFPDKPITKKPAETRMGSGKGNPEEWVAVVKPGRIMFEIAGVDEATAKEALRLAQHKLPIKTKIVTRADQDGEE